MVHESMLHSSILFKVLDSLNGLAKENKDFESAENASFVLPGGITRYFLGLKIFRTTEPKLEQKFSMSLLAVKLLDGDIGNPNFYPRLGSRKSELRIGASNDPRGLFTIYHWNGGVGNATGESITRYVVVEQRPDYSVLLTVDRQGDYKFLILNLNNLHLKTFYFMICSVGLQHLFLKIFMLRLQ